MKKEYPLFTYILAHYDQYHYIYTALDSILEQEYPLIEIIVIDDHSAVFDQEELLKYIEKNKRENIKSFHVLANDENIGTVRSLNRAMKTVTGEFIQLFAADDRLPDERVAMNFIDEFEKLGAEAEMICAVRMMMDEELTPPGEYTLPPDQHERYNAMEAQEQFETMAIKCDWAMGAICARTELYKRMGYFSENYKYIEDWAFYLLITRSGVKVHTAGFKALDHRGGGISQSFAEAKTPQAFGYVQDIIELREKEVFPYLKTFSLATQDDIIERYYREYDTYEKMGGERKKLRWYNFLKYSKRIVVRRVLRGLRRRAGRAIKRR